MVSIEGLIRGRITAHDLCIARVRRTSSVQQWRNQIVKVSGHVITQFDLHRMVIIYLIFVIPIILLGIYLYSWSYHNASQEISRSAGGAIASYLDNLEREIAWLELQMFDIMEDREIHRAAVTWSLLSNVERKNSLIYVLQRLVSIKNTSSLIKDVYFHMRPAEQSVSAVLEFMNYDRGAFDELSWNSRYQEGKFILDERFIASGCDEAERKEGRACHCIIVQIALDRKRSFVDGPVEQIFSGSGSLLSWIRLNFMIASGEGDHQLLARIIQEGAGFQVPRSWRSKARMYQFHQMASEELNLHVVSYLPEDELKRPFIDSSSGRGSMLVYLCLPWWRTPTSVTRRSISRCSCWCAVSARWKGACFDIHIDHNQRDEFGYLYDRLNQ